MGCPHWHWAETGKCPHHGHHAHAPEKEWPMNEELLPAGGTDAGATACPKATSARAGLTEACERTTQNLKVAALTRTAQGRLRQHGNGHRKLKVQLSLVGSGAARGLTWVWPQLPEG